MQKTENWWKETDYPIDIYSGGHEMTNVSRIIRNTVGENINEYIMEKELSRLTDLGVWFVESIQGRTLNRKEEEAVRKKIKEWAASNAESVYENGMKSADFLVGTVTRKAAGPMLDALISVIGSATDRRIDSVEKGASEMTADEDALSAALEEIWKQWKTDYIKNNGREK